MSKIKLIKKFREKIPADLKILKVYSKSFYKVVVACSKNEIYFYYFDLWHDSPMYIEFYELI